MAAPMKTRPPAVAMGPPRFGVPNRSGMGTGARSRMEAAASLAVPLVVDCGVGANWDEAH